MFSYAIEHHANLKVPPNLRHYTSCANDPENIAGLRFGDVRTVDRSQVSDWMIMENGECYGGYTIRVLSELDPANAPPLKFVDYPTTEITRR